MTRVVAILTTLLELGGMATVVVGVWMVSVPAALVLAGAFAILVGVAVG